MACELIPQCIFFNERVKSSPEAFVLYKARYCNGEHTECARYLVFVALGKAAVPTDLFPNDRLRALTIVRTAGSSGGGAD
jgi:hypothetical protein